MVQMQTISKGNTKVTGSRENLSVTLYQTEVVLVKDGQVILNTGGHFTATTKARMNQAANEYGLDFYVYQRAGDWFVRLVNTGRADKPFHGCSVSFALRVSPTTHEKTA